MVSPKSPTHFAFDFGETTPASVRIDAMRYAFHFEFCERPELPAWLRGDVFRSLAFIEEKFGLSRVLTQEVPQLIRSLQPRRVIELGSGSGDGLALLSRGASSAGAATELDHLATDKFPQVELWREKLASVPGARWCESSVGFDDFDRVLPAADLVGSAVVLISAFHHLPQSQARDFLARAARAGAHVVVVEPLSRSLLGMLMGLGAGLASLIIPLVALFSGKMAGGGLRQLLDHWLVPVVPFILSHDGLVSALRQRTITEWRELVAGLPFDLESTPALGPFANFSALVLRHH